jgi:hypothetical protein
MRLGDRCSVPDEYRKFYLLYHVQTGSEAYSIVFSILGGK